MTACRWYWMWSPGWVGHMVTGGLRRYLVADLRARIVPPFEISKLEHVNARPAKPTTVHMHFDLGGMMYTDRPTERINIAGLRLSLPCDQLAAIIGNLQSLDERRFTDGPAYYKLHGFHRALVLTPSHRQAFLDELRKRLPSAEVRAKAFYAERDVPSVMLRKVHARVHEVPIAEVPDLGGHHLDRFAPKQRGQA